MKPRLRLESQSSKMNITVGIEPTICAPKTARLPAAIIVIFISAQRYNYFLNHQTKNRKKITYRRKKHGKLYKKTQNAS